MPELYLQNLNAGDEDERYLDSGIAISQFPFLIGRSAECDHHIGHPMISRQHCSFLVRDKDVYVADRGSRNGTFLNGERISEARPVGGGELLNLAHQFYFQIHRPMSSLAEALSNDAADLIGGPAGRREHVLVVEDNEDTAATLALVLTRWGYKVRVAHDGPQALESAAADPPDTVLLDIRLSGMNGCRVAERLRIQAGMDKTRIVAITGYDPDKVPCLPEGPGFDQVLKKPVDPENLEKILRRTN